MDDRLTDIQKLAGAYEPPMVQTLKPDVQSVFKNLGVDTNIMSDTPSATTNKGTVATPVVGGNNLLSLLPFLSSSMAQNKTTPAAMPTAVANPGLFAQREKDLYSMFRS